MDNIDKKIQEILDSEKNTMQEYLKWYLNLPGEFSGKIRINRKYAKSIKNEIRKSKDAYPTKLVYMLEISPNEYNQRYPKAVMYENYKMKAYSILYMDKNKENGWYDEDMGFAIGLELIFKEFVDKHQEWSNLIKY